MSSDLGSLMKSFRAVRGSGDDALVLVFRKQRSIEEVHGDLRLSCVRISELKIFSTACRRRCRCVPSCDGTVGNPSPRNAGCSGCPRSRRCWAASASAPGIRESAPDETGTAAARPRPARNPGHSEHWPRSEEHTSEEHTSELQSLMRNSYAVFCLT